jgi:hypothetical protein
VPLARLFSRVFWILGMILIVSGAVALIERQVFISSSNETQGLVVDVRVVQNQVLFMNDDTGFHYYPTIEFSDTDGSAHRFESPAGITSVKYEIGQDIPILYQQQDPSNAIIKTTWGIYGLSIILFGTGLLFIIFGLVAFKGFDKKKY